MLGDVLVFKRQGGGHVGLYVGEDKDAYHVLGGNQSDSVSITRILKDRLHAARRCTWKTAQPANVRRVFLSGSGAVSQNEA
jgi:cell wall-associated NlpC family hydrolase